MKKLIIALAILCAANVQAVEYGNILSVTPVLEHVATSKINCQGYQEEGSVVATGVGAGIGGWIGSLFGKGRGKIVTTAVGGIAGGAAAYELSKTPQGNGCREIITNEPVPGGYLVVYEYNGQTYKTRTRTIPTSNEIELNLQPVPVVQ